MLVHRFIGLSEIKALAKGETISPIGKRECLYFFPNDGDYHESPEYELNYIHGIVGEIWLDNNKVRRFCKIDLDLDGSKLVCEYRPYADPEGDWYDRIQVSEYHLYGGYDAANVVALALYEDSFMYRKVSQFANIVDAHAYLTQHNARE